MTVRGFNFPVLDVGWPPLAAITWGSPIAPISILLDNSDKYHHDYNEYNKNYLY